MDCQADSAAGVQIHCVASFHTVPWIIIMFLKVALLPNKPIVTWFRPINKWHSQIRINSTMTASLWFSEANSTLIFWQTNIELDNATIIINTKQQQQQKSLNNWKAEKVMWFIFSEWENTGTHSSVLTKSSVSVYVRQSLYWVQPPKLIHIHSHQWSRIHEHHI